jgi:hypothetical protein
MRYRPKFELLHVDLGKGPLKISETRRANSQTHNYLTDVKPQLVDPRIAPLELEKLQKLAD